MVVIFTLIGVVIGAFIGVFVGINAPLHPVGGQRKVSPTTSPTGWSPRMPVVPVCGCGHAYSFHSPTEKHAPCKHLEPGERYWTFDNGMLQTMFGGYYKEKRCSCVQYVGPLPLPEYTALEA